MSTIKRILYIICIYTSCLTEAYASGGQDVTTYTGKRGIGAQQAVEIAKAVLKIGEETKEKAVCPGENVTISLEVTGMDQYSVIWKKVDESEVVQAEGTSLILNGVTTAERGAYYCELVDKADGDRLFYSDTLTLKIREYEVSVLADKKLGCVEDTIVLRADCGMKEGITDTLFMWTTTAGEIVGDADRGSVRVALKRTGNVQLVSSAFGCQEVTSAVDIEVQQMSLLLKSPENKDVCRNELLTLSAEVGGDASLGEPVYQWTGEGIQGAADVAQVNILLEENGKFVVEAALGVCTAKDSVTFDIHGFTVDIVPPESLNVCKGDTLELQARTKMPEVAGDMVYKWTAEHIVGPDNLSTVILVAGQDGKVVLNAGDRYCSDSKTLDFKIQTFDAKIKTPSAERDICIQSPLQLEATWTGSTLSGTPVYRWRGEGIQGNTVARRIDVVVGTDARYVLEASYGVCESEDSVTYTVHQLQMGIMPVETLRICNRDTVNLKSVFGMPLAERDTVFEWIAEKIIGPADRDSLKAVLTTDGVVKLRGSDRYCTDTAEIHFNVQQFNVKIQAPGTNRRVCAGDSLVLLATGTKPAIYEWLGDGIYQTAEGAVKVCFEQNGEFILNSRNDECRDTDTIRYVLEHLVAKIMAPSEERDLCAGELLTLNSEVVHSETGEVMYRWEGEGIQGMTDQPEVNIRAENQGTYVLHASLSKCRVSDTIEYQVHRFDVGIIAPERQKVCYGDTLILRATHLSVTGDTTYLWTAENIIGPANLDSVKIVLTENGHVALAARSGDCIANDACDFQIVHYGVKINTLSSEREVCLGSELILMASNANMAPAGSEWSWSGEGVKNISGSTARIKFADNGEFVLNYTDGFCRETDTIRFTVRKYEVNIEYGAGDLNRCWKDEVTLYASNRDNIPAGAVYTWKGQGINNTLPGKESVTVKLDDQGEYSLRAFDGKCYSDDTVRFVIRKYDAGIQKPQQWPDVCKGEELRLSATNAGNAPESATYHWGGEGLIGADNAAEVTYQVGTKAEYTLDAFDGVCHTYDTLRFNVQQYNIGIKIPATGTAVCYGGEMTLETTVSPVPEGATFWWEGSGISGDRQSPTAKVKFTDNGVFSLRTTKGVCTVEDQINFNIKKYEVSIPASLSLSEPQRVTINAIRGESNSVLDWYLNNVRQEVSPTADFAEFFIPAEGAAVKVVMTVNADKCQTSAICNVRVSHRDVHKYHGGQADGFSQSRPKLLLRRADTTVCLNTPLIARLQNFIYTGYNYEWYKVGEEANPPLCQQEYLEILRCSLNDGGQYYCRVKDADGDGYIYSDTLQVTVMNGPVARIDLPAGGTEYCYGERVVLNAGNSGSEYQYRWNGPDVPGGVMTPELSFLAKKGGLYVVTVSDGSGCASVDSIRIQVGASLEMDIPDRINLAAPQTVKVSAWQNRTGGKLVWDWQGAKFEGESVSLDIRETGTIYAELSEGKCQVQDSCQVTIKLPATFRNGDGDGFDESTPKLLVVEKEIVRCSGEEAVMNVRGISSYSCDYKWFRTDMTEVVGLGKSYVIPFCETVHSGEYYCKAVSGDKIWYSDTLSLTVNQGPVAKITKDPDGDRVCFGEQKSFHTETPEGNYEWSGDGIIGGRNTQDVTLLPERSGIYILKVTQGSCSTMDTVHLRVIQPQVDIPDLLSLPEQQEVKLSAWRENPAVEVVWYVNGSKVQTTNKDSVILNIPGTGQVVAEIREEGCYARDTMLVFVKEQLSFKTGQSGDDGFAQSRKKLKVLENYMNPCPTEDIVMQLQKDNTGYTNYRWFRITASGDQEVSRTMTYQIQNCDATYNGEYFCRAEHFQESGFFYSDTLELAVRTGIVADIISESGDDLCYGDDLILHAQPVAPGYTYRWTGPGVAEEATSSTLLLKVEEPGQYRLTVSNGDCQSSDTMSVAVTRLQIDMASTMLLKAGGMVPFTVATRESPVSWYVNNSLKGRSVEPLTNLQIDGNSRVVAVVESAHCRDSAVCEVFVKNKDLFASGIDDGFAESKPSLEVEKHLITVCRGHEIAMAVKDVGYPGYVYKWYKDEGIQPVYVGRRYVIPESGDRDAGSYVCKVVRADADPGEAPVLTSGTVTVVVIKGPMATIAPLSSSQICYGEKVHLDASVAEDFNETGTPFQYKWSGPGAEGITTSRLFVAPENDAFYIVEVSDPVTKCADTASVAVAVKRVQVEIISRLVLPKPQDYRFRVYNPEGAGLEWFVNGAVSDSDLLHLSENCQVVVKATVGGCSEYDTCDVVIRNKDLYVVQGGDDDGFDVSVVLPSVKVSPKDLSVCASNVLTINLQVYGDGLFRYKWYKVGQDSQVLGEEKNYVVPDAVSTVEGDYYCIVENLLEPDPVKRIMFSDTASVTFREGPRAKIGSPADGADICNGVKVTLDASASEDGKPGVNYNYEWFGEGADGLTGKTVTFVPKGERYIVRVSESGNDCKSTDTVYLNMNRPEIIIPDQIHLNAAKLVELKPEKKAETRLNWYIDNNRVLSNSDIGRLNVKNNCRVVAEIVMDVEGGTCSGYDTAFVYIKNPVTFRTGEGADDGFDLSMPQVDVRQKDGETRFCRGTRIFRTLVDGLAERLLSYQWRKVGSLKVISTKKNLVIEQCELSDSGRYYCVAVDLASTDASKVYYSDTVSLSVVPGPKAQISSPLDGTVVCYNANINLDASQTEVGKYPYTDVYTYEWSGAGIAVPSLYRTSANPTESCDYILKVTNGTCTTYDTASVVVWGPEVHIRRTLSVPARGVQQFVVENPKKNNVNWYVDNTLKVGKKDTANINIFQDCSVVVEMEEDGCRKTDTCFVFLKDPRSFTAGIGEAANDDGFSVSGSSFYIRKVISTEWVCEGATSVFTVEVVGNDFYRYAWKKSGNPTVLSTEQTYRIEKTSPEDAGSYYCEVTDVSNNKTRLSEEVPLEVIAMPVTKILSSSNKICEGSSLTLQADQSLLTAGREYTYLWTGVGVTDNRNSSITVQPANSGRYVLTVSDANCFTKDTLEVEVIKEGLKIQKVYTIKEGEDISIPATVASGTVVNWRVDGIWYRNVNPLVLKGQKKSVEYMVEATGVCQLQETGRLFVRTNAGYAGGEEDGFTMPNGLPQIIDQSPEIVGCGKDTATLWVEVLKKEEIENKGKYSWEQYSETERDFVPVTEPLDGHITGLGTDRIHFKVILPEDEGRYRCRVYSSYGVADSKEINLVRGTIPVINGKMNDVYECENATTVKFLAVASVPGGKDPNYRWYYSATPDNFGQLLPEEDYNKAYHQINELKKSDEGYYRIEAYNLCGAVYDTAYLEVWQRPSVVRQNADTAVCLGGEIRLWTEAEGGGAYGYTLIQVEVDKNGRYVRDKRVLPSSLNPWYDIEVASEIDEGYYLWKVWNKCDSIRGTKLFYLDVQEKPLVNYGFTDTTLCLGTRTLLLDASKNIVSPEATTHYYWTKQDVRLSQTSLKYTISSLSYADTGVYKCYAYNACQPQLMKEFRVHKKEVPSLKASIALDNSSYCEGEPVRMVVGYTSDAGEVSRQWYFKGAAIHDSADGRLLGSLSDTLKIDSAIASDIGRYYVKLTNECGDRLSNEINLQVDMPARFAVSGDLTGKDQYLCLGDNTAITVTATGKADIKYTWTKDGEVIANARERRLQLTQVNASMAGVYCCYIQNSCNLKSESTCAALTVITPKVFDVLGSGKYCGYEQGREVTLSGFERNAVYQLFRYQSNGTAVEMKRVNGADVEEGGILSFGYITNGTYYVQAVITEDGKVCTALMNGDIEIVRDITPAQFDLVVSDPICTGETSGSLTLQGSENNPDIAYTLQRENEEGTWADYGQAIPGNGGKLTWGNLAKGMYRVMAVSTTSGCELQIGEIDTLVERPYPKVFRLTAVNDDTTNCQFMEADVALQLEETEDGCEYTLLRNGVSTGRTLSGASVLWDKVSGEIGGTYYSVQATSAYGCSREMGNITVVEKKAPAGFLVSGGGYYCSGDNGKQEITIEGETQSGIRYDIYREDGIQVLTDTVFYGTGKPIVFELSNEGARYYVEALDTLDGCVMRMDNEVSILEDSLKILPIPAQKIHVQTEAYLYADVRNAVGTYTINWQPEDKFPAGGNTVMSPVTLPLERGQLFVVTVDDGHCTAETTAEVRFYDGEEQLYTEIKLYDCLTDADTLRLCEGEPVNLCSWTSGGIPGYSWRWIDKEVADNAISAESRLKNYAKLASGYIYLEVESSVGQRVSDSIWIEFRPKPLRNIEIVNSGLNCALDKEEVEFIIRNAEQDVAYQLEFSADGRKYRPTGLSETGDGGMLPFSVFYADTTAGYYRFRAIKDYGDGNVCQSEINAGELRQRPQRYAVESVGITDYCADTRQDSIRLLASENGVVYRLIETGRKKLIQSREGDEEELLFTGNWGTGRYRVVGQLGMCRDTMGGIVNINAKPRPVIGDVEGLGAYCLSSSVPVQDVVVLKTMAGIEYRLFRDSVNQREVVAKDYGNGTPLVLGQLNKPGNYFIVSSGKDGAGCTDTLRGFSAVNAPEPVRLVDQEAMYCFGEDGVDVTVKIFDIDPLVTYCLRDLNRNAVGIFGNRVEDTLYCSVNLKKGKYYIWPEVADCSNMLGMFQVNEHKQLVDNSLLRPLGECNGFALIMGVQNSEKNITYELYKEVDGSLEYKLAEAIGDGKDLIIDRTQNQTGIYSVRAVDPAGCSLKLTERYVIGDLPKVFAITASATEYCAGEAGVVLGIEGTEADVHYLLQKWDEVQAQYMNVSSSAVIYGTGSLDSDGKPVAVPFSGKFKAGRYRIVTEGCHHVVMDGEVEINEIPRPLDIEVVMKGMACVDSTFSITLKATEPGIKYVVYHNNVKVELDTLIGNGGDMSWTFTKAGAGVYSVGAIRKYCVYPLTKTIAIGVPTELVDLSGTEPLCANKNKTLQLIGADLEAGYELWGSQRDTTFKGVIAGDNIEFSGVIPGDTYCVIARNQMCVTRSKPYEFIAKELPVLNDENFVVEDCNGSGLGDIALRSPEVSYAYQLEGQGYDIQIMDRNRDTVFAGMPAGEYALTVTNRITGCVLDPVYRTVRRALPADSVILPLDYCAGDDGARIQLSGSTYNVLYTLLDEDKQELESIRYPAKAFARNYRAGRYIFKKENQGLNGGCISYIPIEIRELPIPDVNMEVVQGGGGALCETGNSRITIRNSQSDVEYVLRRDGIYETDTVRGNGGAVVFEKRKLAGQYEIVARTAGLCQAVLPDQIEVNPVPGKINVSDPVYCYDPSASEDERGTQVFVKNLDPSAKYYFCDNGLIDSVSGMNSGNFKVVPAGEYVITGIYPATGCRDTVARVIVREISLPVVYGISNMVGGDCDTRARVCLASSEGDSVEYCLYMNQYILVSGPVKGTGGPIEFGEVEDAGSYQVYAKKTGSDCGVWMDGKIVIASEALAAEFEVRGTYCEGAASGSIELALLNAQRGWTYFVSSGADESVRILAKDQQLITWEKVGGKIIADGIYTLKGINECGEELELAVAEVKPAPKPAVFKIKGGDAPICQDSLNDQVWVPVPLVLESSQKDVSYRLLFRNGDEVTELLPEPVAGTGGEVSLGEYRAQGDYYVLATVDSSGCFQYVDTVNLKNSIALYDPKAKTNDTCVMAGSRPSLVINISQRKQPYVDYLLKVNGVFVDTISKDADEYMMSFKPQNIIGHYYIYAKSAEGCIVKYNGPTMGENPRTDIDILGDQKVNLCSGDIFPLKLATTELGVRYSLVKDGLESSVALDGVDKELWIDNLSQTGRYQVMAKVSNECKVLLDDYVDLTVLQRPELDIDQALGYCAGGKGVPIFVRNTVLSDNSFDPPGVDYTLFRMTTAKDSSRMITMVGNGGDLYFTNAAGKSEFEAGLYSVRAIDRAVRVCPASKRVNISAIDLPQAFELQLQGNKYMCEYPEERSLILAGSQPNVRYSLYRRSYPGELAAPVQDGNGKMLTFQVRDTGVYYVVARSLVGEGCESEMANEIEIKVPEALKVFELESVVDGYCETETAAIGSVKLSGSELKVNYELNKDGSPVGNVKPGSGSGLKWSALDGKPTSQAIGGDLDGYIYTVTAVHQETGCRKQMRGSVSIIEESAPVVKEQTAVNVDVCMGNTQTLGVIAAGGKLNYQWKKGGDIVSESASYTIDSVLPEHIGVYQCIVSNHCGSDQAAPIHVNVRAVVVMEKKMEDILVCEEPANIRISSTAVAEKYEWFKAGESDPLAVNNQVLELSNVGSEAEGLYVCYASTTCGGIYDTCRLEFNRRPEVVWNGAGIQTLCVGSEHTLQVESRDTVKWFLNGTALNVEGNTYHIDSLVVAQGGLYSVVAENKCNRTEQIPLQTLNVDEPIEVIEVSDSLQHYCKGNRITLSIKTKPEERVTYRWYRANIYQKAGRTLDIDADASQNNVNFYVTYANACTNMNERLPQRGMNIRVDDKVTFDKLGAETILCAEEGGQTELRLKQTEAGGETYQWYYRPLTGTTASLLTEEGVALTLPKNRKSDGYYFCQITNACGTVLTDTTMLRVDSIPVILGNLRDTTVCENSDLDFSLGAKGGNLTYRWMMQRKNSAEITYPELYSPEGFESESRWKLQGLKPADDSCSIWCEVSNGCAAIYSDTAVIRVIPNATVIFEEQEVRFCEGDTRKVVVKLEHGTVPSVYKYTLNDGAPTTREFLTRLTDTILLTEVGVYQVVSLASNADKCVNKTPDALMQAQYYEPFTATLSGDAEGCVGMDAVFTVTIDKGEGPWKVEIIRDSDGKPADEIGVFPMTLTDKVSVLTFKPAKNERYRIKRVVDAGMTGGGCIGLTAGSAGVIVHQPSRVAFKSLNTDTFGGCKEVDFNQLLRPTVTNGAYYVNYEPVESTLLNQNPGQYKITYVTTTEFGCVDSATVNLIRASLPKVSVSAEKELCPGESTDMLIHVDGTTPLTVYTNMKEIGLDGRETFYNNLRKSADANGDCVYAVFNNNNLRYRTYEVIKVTDKYGCTTDPALPNPKVTITMRERPVMKVETQHALYNNGGWTSEIKDFMIPDQASVRFRITEIQGGNPWNLKMVKTTPDGQVDTRYFNNLIESYQEIYPATEGEYRFSISDQYCSIAEELEEVRKVSYTETGFLRVKVMLEGAFSVETGRMRSQISDLLPLKGMESLPDAGDGNQWIDWVVMELRKDVNDAATVRDTLLLRSDGYLADRTGNTLLSVIGENFSLLESNIYHVVIKHRNHLAIASVGCRIFTEPVMATLVDLTNSAYVYTKDGNITNHMKELTVIQGRYVWGMAVGNILSNSLISIANPNEIQRLGIQNSLRGYYLHDVNFDGVVKWNIQGIIDGNSVATDKSDDAYFVFKNRNLFSEIPEN